MVKYSSALARSRTGGRWLLAACSSISQSRDENSVEPEKNMAGHMLIKAVGETQAVRWSTALGQGRKRTLDAVENVEHGLVRLLLLHQAR